MACIRDRTQNMVVIMKIGLVLIALGMLGGVCQAEIYRSVDAQGNPVFTDTPSSTSKPVTLKAPSTYRAPSLPPLQSGSASGSRDEVPSSYATFAVVAPGDGQSFWDNTGDVRISLALQPALNTAAGHRIQFYLDGVAQGEPVTALSAVINNVDRGEHQVSAAVMTADGRVLLETRPVTFTLHRQSINFPARRAKPAP